MLGIDNVIISRTGYTGADGFELCLPAVHAPALWAALMSAGDVTPAGLRARDTLRLEMGMAPFGNDIDDSVTPFEANLAWLARRRAPRRWTPSRVRRVAGPCGSSRASLRCR